MCVLKTVNKKGSKFRMGNCVCRLGVVLAESFFFCTAEVAEYEVLF